MASKQHKDPTLFGTIQSEVSHEASPFLEFLLRNTKLIVVFFLLFLVAIAGYWIYSGKQAKSHLNAMKELGAIVTIANVQDRFTALDAYIKDAPSYVESEALFALAVAAQEAGKFDVAYASWDKIGKKFPDIVIQATFGKTKSLLAEGKNEEALATLEAILPSLNQGTVDSVNVNSNIIAIAEILGKYDRAITSCEVLANQVDTSEGSTFWQQKLFELKEKQKKQKADQK